MRKNKSRQYRIRFGSISFSLITAQFVNESSSVGHLVATNWIVGAAILSRENSLNETDFYFTIKSFIIYANYDLEENKYEYFISREKKQQREDDYSLTDHVLSLVFLEKKKKTPE